MLKESPIRTKYKPEVEQELQHIEDKDEQDIARNLMKIAKRFASAQSEAARGFSRFCCSSHVKPPVKRLSRYAWMKSDEMLLDETSSFTVIISMVLSGCLRNA